MMNRLPLTVTAFVCVTACLCVCVVIVPIFRIAGFQAKAILLVLTVNMRLIVLDLNHFNWKKESILFVSTYTEVSTVNKILF